MATGPEHYLHAQRLMLSVTLDGTHPDGSPVIRDEPHVIAAAAVHAQLATAAAIASGTMNRSEWFKATLTVPEGPVEKVLPS